jgi:hypothetical protein
MAVIRVRIADATDDSEPPGRPQPGHPAHRGIQAQLAVELMHLVSGVGEVRPGVVIGRVCVGDHRVQPVVAAVQRDDHQNPGSGRQRVCGRTLGEGVPADQARTGRRRGHPGGARSDQEASTGQGVHRVSRQWMLRQKVSSQWVLSQWVLAQ